MVETSIPRRDEVLVACRHSSSPAEAEESARAMLTSAGNSPTDSRAAAQAGVRRRAAVRFKGHRPIGIQPCSWVLLE